MINEKTENFLQIVDSGLYFYLPECWQSTIAPEYDLNCLEMTLEVA